MLKSSLLYRYLFDTHCHIGLISRAKKHRNVNNALPASFFDWKQKEAKTSVVATSSDDANSTKNQQDSEVEGQRLQNAYESILSYIRKYESMSDSTKRNGEEGRTKVSPTPVFLLNEAIEYFARCCPIAYGGTYNIGCGGLALVGVNLKTSQQAAFVAAALRFLTVHQDSASSSLLFPTKEVVHQHEEEKDSKKNVDGSNDVHEIIRRSIFPPYAAIGYSVGIHPHEANYCQEWWHDLEKLCFDQIKAEDEGEERKNSFSHSSSFAEFLHSASSSPPSLFPWAIGETGLDYFKSQTSKKEQVFSLHRHFELSVEKQLPLIIHCREAYQDFYEEWDHFIAANSTYLRIQQQKTEAKVTDESSDQKQQKINPGPTSSENKKICGVMHCFSSNVKDMHRAMERNFLVSFCGTLTYPRSHELREACRLCPMESMVMETDAPFLPPQSMRGAINEPRYVHEVFEQIVALKTEEKMKQEGRDQPLDLRRQRRHEIEVQLWKNSMEGLFRNKE